MTGAWSRRAGFASITAAATLLAAAGCVTDAPESTPTVADAEWAHYGGDAGGTKYAPLAQVNRGNVARLRVAWMARTDHADTGGVIAIARGQEPVSARTHPNPARPPGRSRVRFETTPLKVWGTVYVATPRGRVLALDPASGELRWSFDARLDRGRHRAEGLTTRGLAAWSDPDAAPGPRCGRRIFLATVDARLLALDAADGTLCTDFGDRGEVDLLQGAGLAGEAAEPSRYTVTSPPAVLEDVVVVGSAVNKTADQDAPSGVVRAFDARGGALRWSFDPIPRDEAHPAWTSWTPESARTTGGANVWSLISADPERGLIFLPTASAAPDFYGGGRPGRNDHANSVVALRAATGEVAWAFQVVHHDLWDYDVAAQPMLVTLRRDGREVDAVVVGTKMGMVFVLDRETGAPLFPVEERPVPGSDVPGEAAWPTQPFPVRTPLLHGTRLTPDSAFGVNVSDRTACRERIARLRNEGIFTPPSLEGTLVWPGFWGGVNWDGLAWDPERQRVVTTVKRLAMEVRLHPRDQVPDALRDPPPGQQYLPQEGTPYAVTRAPLTAPSGIPCTPPPWGALVALDLADDSIAWTRPLGAVPSLSAVPDSETWGSIVFGGPLVTAGGLVFVGASQDDRFRAFDIDTGALLWEHRLPAGGQAAPMTYVHDGWQYIVIAAGGRAGIGSEGDWLVAFALPSANR